MIQNMHSTSSFRSILNTAQPIIKQIFGNAFECYGSSTNLFISFTKCVWVNKRRKYLCMHCEIDAFDAIGNCSCSFQKCVRENRLWLEWNIHNYIRQMQCNEASSNLPFVQWVNWVCYSFAFMIKRIPFKEVMQLALGQCENSNQIERERMGWAELTKVIYLISYRKIALHHRTNEREWERERGGTAIFRMVLGFYHEKY